MILMPAPNSSRICQIETLRLACITLKNPCIPHCSWVTRLPASSKQGVSLSEWVGWPSAAHLLRPIKNSLVSCVFGLGINRQFPQGAKLYSLDFQVFVVGNYEECQRAYTQFEYLKVSNIYSLGFSIKYQIRICFQHGGICKTTQAVSKYISTWAMRLIIYKILNISSHSCL